MSNDKKIGSPTGDPPTRNYSEHYVDPYYVDPVIPDITATPPTDPLSFYSVHEEWREFSTIYNSPVSVVQDNNWSGYGILIDETPSYIILNPITDKTLTCLWTSHLIEMQTFLKKATVISLTVLDKDHDDGRESQENETRQREAPVRIPPPFGAAQSSDS